MFNYLKIIYSEVMSLTWPCTNQNALYPECGTSDLLHSDTPSQRISAPIDKHTDQHH